MALDETVQALWRLAVHPDLGAHLALLGVLWFVGRTLTGNHTHVRSWAARTGVVTFFMMLAVLFVLEPHTLQSPGSTLGIVLRAVLVAALAGTAAMSFFLPLSLCHDVVVRLTAPCRRWRSHRIDKKQQRLRDLNVARQEALEHERRLAQLDRKQQEEMDLARQESDAAKADVERLEAQARQRFELTVMYERHFGTLQNVLPRERFEKLLEQSVALTSDTGNGPAVLRKLIEELQATQGRREFKDLSDIIEHFQLEREKIERLALPRADIDSLLASLNMSRSRTLEEFATR